MDRQTLRDWVHRFNAQEIEGLANKAIPGRSPALSEEQMAQLREIVLRVPDNITLLPLPSYSPQLNPVENVWDYVRGNCLNQPV
jgi:transposase